MKKTTQENRKRDSSKTRKKFVLFHTKFTNIENNLLSWATRINELEASHKQLVEKTEANMANASEELKAVRKELRMKDQKIEDLVVKFEELQVQVKESKVNCDKSTSRADSFQRNTDTNGLTKKRKSKSWSKTYAKQEPWMSPTNIKDNFKSSEEVKVDVNVDAGAGGLIKQTNSFGEEKTEEYSLNGKIIGVDDQLDRNGTGDKFECPVCGEEFKSLKKVGRHLKCHDPPNPKLPHSSSSTLVPKTKSSSFKCGVCGRELCSAQSLKRHSKNIHNNVGLDPESTTVSARLKSRSLAYSCNFCTELFPTWFKFKSEGHMARHEDLFCTTKILPPVFQGSLSLTKFSCCKCPKHCETKDILKVHVTKVHLWSKPFQCNVKMCTRSFSTSECLRRHSKYHKKNFD